MQAYELDGVVYLRGIDVLKVLNETLAANKVRDERLEEAKREIEELRLALCEERLFQSPN